MQKTRKRVARTSQKVHGSQKKYKSETAPIKNEVNTETKTEILEEAKSVLPMVDQNPTTKKPVIAPKPYTVHDTAISKATKWIEVPIKELREYCKYEMEYEKVNPDDFVCPICRMDYYDNLLTLPETEVDAMQEDMVNKKTEIPVVMLAKCQSHFYHKECIENMAKSTNSESLKCPVCGVIYGVLIGDMPDGRMYIKVHPKRMMPCAGYEKCGTIEITYSVFDGIRNGTEFYGTIRESYLPDTAEGRKILRLLKIAFQRRLTFTVGTSITTGATNCVVWNGIHHKTNLRGGSSHYGYPDPTYFNRVKEELAAKGVYED